MSGAPFRLVDLARRLGTGLSGNPELEVQAVRVLHRAGPGDISFLTNPALRGAAEASAAGALLVPEGLQGLGGNLLVAKAPTVALAQLLEIFYPAPVWPPGIHATAVVGEGVLVDPTAHIGPYVVLGADSKVGAGAAILAHSVLGRACCVGAKATLHPHVVLYAEVTVGERCIIHSGAVLGADGFGYTQDQGAHLKIPQVGATHLGREVEIGANSTIDRAMVEETFIGAGTKIDNLVQVGHNVRLGESCMLSGQSGIAGSAQLGDFVVLGGQSGVGGHIELGDGVQVAAKSAVFGSVEAGAKVGGIPAGRLSGWRRQVAIIARLPQMLKRLRALERRLDQGSEAVEAKKEPTRD